MNESISKIPDTNTSPIEGTSQEDALIQRLGQDHDLMTKLLLNKDVEGIVKSEGFEVDETFMQWVELGVKKIRTYITDQLHFMSAQYARNPASLTDGNNGAQDW